MPFAFEFRVPIERCSTGIAKWRSEAMAERSSVGAVPQEKHVVAFDVDSARESIFPPLEAALDASGVIGTWDWNHREDRIRLDRGAAAFLTGDASFGGRSLTSAVATALVHPDDIDLLLMEAMRATSFGGRFTAECRVLHRDRGLRWVETRGFTVMDDLGRSLRTRGIVIDITDDRAGKETLLLTSPDSLSIATDHIIAARKALGNAPIPRVRTALDIALMVIGDLIAGQHEATQPELHH